jgi:hypothetical protein
VKLFQNLPTNFVEISVKMQRICDAAGTRLLLDSSSFDPNFTFGNPSPGVPKILEVLLDCQGHDAERTTDSQEVMDTGYSRNYITVKTQRFNIVVLDEEEGGGGRGVMQEAMDFHTEVTPSYAILNSPSIYEK